MTEIIFVVVLAVIYTAVLIYCGAVIEYKRMEHKRKKNDEHLYW